MLQVYKLNKRFGRHVALDDVTFQVERGETLAVMGPSGCGKSTLLRSLHRLISVDSGEIWWDDVPVMDLVGEDLRRYRRKIGFVFQHQNLIHHLNALENVLLGPVLSGVPGERANWLAAQALDQVGLLSKAYEHPAAMSGGERQRVGIARALAMEPELILWDEPTAALDSILVDEVLSIMARLARSRNTAMVVVTHEMPFALEAADRVVLMERGRVVGDGPPRDVLLSGETELSKKFRRLYEIRHSGRFGDRISGRNEARGPRRFQEQLPSPIDPPVSTGRHSAMS